MKFIIRFCSQWGNYTTKVLTTTKQNISVNEFKVMIEELTEIENKNQILIHIQNGKKVQLQSEKQLSDYNLEEACIIYVNQVNDQEENKEEEFQSSLSVSSRYFSKLGIITEEQVFGYKQNISVIMHDEDEAIPEVKLPKQRSRYMDIEQEFINFIRKNDWNSAVQVYKKSSTISSQSTSSTIGDIQKSINTSEVQTVDLINDIRLTGWNALHFSCFQGHHEIVGELIKLKADINLTTRDDWSPIQLAIQKNHYQVISLLTERMDLDVNYYSHGGSVLQMAAKKGNLQMVQQILNHPNINLNYINLEDFDLTVCSPQNYQAIQLKIQNSQIDFLLQPNIREIIGEPLQSDSFLDTVQLKPKSSKGYLNKLNYLPIFFYKRFFVLDPDYGTFARYKNEEDFPLRPIQVIALSSIHQISEIKGLWYTEVDTYYLQVQYKDYNSHISHITICSKSDESILYWKEALQQAFTYSQYLENKLQDLQVGGFQHQISICMNEVLQNRKSSQYVKNSTIPFFDDQEIPLPQPIKQPNRAKLLQSIENPMEPFIIEDQNKISTYLKNYKILKMVGHGSFGKVYQVLHIASNKVYAMKQLSKIKLISKKQIKYAVSECNILKQLKSPYIINLYQTFQTPQYLYLIMEFCSGGDLALHLSKHGKLKEQISKLIIREIILALQNLHELDILYRDLKPENILINSNGHIKLVDFGLSKQVQTGMNAKSFCGSPAYLAPEMLNGRGATKATDIYGLGTVMYELLTGDPPYFNENIDVLYDNIKSAQLKFPDSISDDAKILLTSLLQKEPTRRIGCKNLMQIQWLEIKQAKWFGGVFNNLEEKIKLYDDDGVGWISDTDNSDTDGNYDKIQDNDYTENNWKVNRVLDWSFDQMNV